MTVLYDRIGGGYSNSRRADPRIARAIGKALDGSRSVVNVGAGTGSYEPTDRFVVAVEPSRTMLGQRAADAAGAIQASASALPFRDDSFDAAMAVLTVHHWEDQASGLKEMRRVAGRRVVILTWAPDFDGFWLTDYFPHILDIDRQIFPALTALGDILGNISVVELPIPHDCTDGFLGAYWRRPTAYLDAGIRSGMSTFARIPDVAAGVAKLSDDLCSGAWQDKNTHLKELDSLDLGYRLVAAEL